jgi:proline iminopeptidase
MLILYPELKPYKRHQLKVSDLHELYLDEAGNPGGLPVLFVHGGPGGACDGGSRRFYDPSNFRIISFDQRGCGRSTPHGELEENDTANLISDIEAIRAYLKIDKWILFGGSWGSTLSLLYAQEHPDAVRGMVLRGIFLCRQQDFLWLYEGGARRIFPDYWEEFVKAIPENERDNLVQAYYQRLTGDDELARMAAAKAWSAWEGNCSKLRPSGDTMKKFTKVHNALALARIETHFFMNSGFVEENQILKNMDTIKHIPARIVQGRYDMVFTRVFESTISSTHRLKKVCWSSLELRKTTMWPRPKSCWINF